MTIQDIKRHLREILERLRGLQASLASYYREWRRPDKEELAAPPDFQSPVALPEPPRSPVARVALRLNSGLEIVPAGVVRANDLKPPQGRRCLLCGTDGCVRKGLGLLLACDTERCEGVELVDKVMRKHHIEAVRAPIVIVEGEVSPSDFMLDGRQSNLLLDPFWLGRDGVRYTPRVGDRTFVLVDKQLLLELKIPVLARADLMRSRTRDERLHLSPDKDQSLRWRRVQSVADGEVVVVSARKIQVHDALIEQLRKLGDGVIEVLGTKQSDEEAVGLPSLVVSLSDQWNAGTWGRSSVTLQAEGSVGVLGYPVGSFLNRWPLELELTVLSDAREPAESVPPAGPSRPPGKYVLEAVSLDPPPPPDEAPGVRVSRDQSRVIVDDPTRPSTLRVTLRPTDKKEVSCEFSLRLEPSTLPYQRVDEQGREIVGVCAVDIGTSQHCAGLTTLLRGVRAPDEKSLRVCRMDSAVYMTKDVSPRVLWSPVRLPLGDDVAEPGKEVVEYRSLKTLIHRPDVIARSSMYPGQGPRDLLAASVRRLLACVEAVEGVRIGRVLASCPPFYWPKDSPAMGVFEGVMRQVVDGGLAARCVRRTFKVAVERCAEGMSVDPRAPNEVELSIVTDEARAPLYWHLYKRNAERARDAAPKEHDLWVIVIDAGAGTSDVGVAKIRIPKGLHEEITIEKLRVETASVDTPSGRWFPGGDSIDARILGWVLHALPADMALTQVSFEVQGEEKLVKGVVEVDDPASLKKLRESVLDENFQFRPETSLASDVRQLLSFVERLKIAALGQLAPRVSLRWTQGSSVPGGAELTAAEFHRFVAPVAYTVAGTAVGLLRELVADGDATGDPSKTVEVLLSGRAALPGLTEAVREAFSAALESASEFEAFNAGDPFLRKETVDTKSVAWWERARSRPAAGVTPAQAPRSVVGSDPKGVVAGGTLAEFYGKVVGSRFNPYQPLKVEVLPDGLTSISPGTVCEDDGAVLLTVSNEILLGRGARVRLEGGRRDWKELVVPLTVKGDKKALQRGRWRLTVSDGGVIAEEAP